MDVWKKRERDKQGKRRGNLLLQQKVGLNNKEEEEEAKKNDEENNDHKNHLTCLGKIDRPKEEEEQPLDQEFLKTTNKLFKNERT